MMSNVTLLLVPASVNGMFSVIFARSGDFVSAPVPVLFVVVPEITEETVRLTLPRIQAGDSWSRQPGQGALVQGRTGARLAHELAHQLAHQPGFQGQPVARADQRARRVAGEVRALEMPLVSPDAKA